MRKIFDDEQIKIAIAESKYADMLYKLPVTLFLIEYDTNENISSPFMRNLYFQIILSGSLSIYYIREDGTSYNLSEGGKDYVIGELDLFHPHGSVFAEASEPVLALAIDVNIYKSILLENVLFLQFVSTLLADKIASLTSREAVYSSLTDRVVNYMTYISPDHTLVGIEKAAFKLHCSSRQLQRVLSQLENKGVVKKVGKGSYHLL